MVKIWNTKGSQAAKEGGRRSAKTRREKKVAATLEDCTEKVTLPKPALPRVTAPARGATLRARLALLQLERDARFGRDIRRFRDDSDGWNVLTFQINQLEEALQS